MRSFFVLASILSTVCILPVAHAGAVRTRPAALTLDPAALVNPFIGTIGQGNTFPGATTPFGMVQWSPDSSAGGLSRAGGYNHGDLIITGFSLTHLSGAGCGALGNISFLPTIRPITVPPLPNASPYSDRFDRRSEHASPGYYAVSLASGIRTQLSVTPRTGFALLDFPRSRTATVLINTGAGAGATSNTAGALNASVHIVNRYEISGSATGGHFCGLGNTYTVYFDARFDRPFTSWGTWTPAGVRRGSTTTAGPHSGAFLTFDTRTVSSVRVKVGLSYVSPRNARLNLETESAGWSFESIRRHARDLWNRALSAVSVRGGSDIEKRIFYTALYHALLHPNIFSDTNGQYIGFDRQVHVARRRVQYANFSGWDIYRSEIQLLAALFPSQTSDMMQSLVVDAQQSGSLPRWPIANMDTGEMNGDSADPILAGAYAFGAGKFDARTALRFMVAGATRSQSDTRPALHAYLRRGYIPGYNPPQLRPYGAVATTLEYALDDYTIARLARSLHQSAVARSFSSRGQSWRHVFNVQTQWIEPRMDDGKFPARFDTRSMDGFVEGNAWQYLWMVPQDLPGLFRLLGGKRAAIARLDSFFRRIDGGPTTPYYWPGNEPDLQAPWLYDFAGAPRRTQTVVRRILLSAYSTAPGGLPGNDDLGELSSWYVWAAMGLYPVTPGTDVLALASPLFPAITINPTGGKPIHISAPGASPTRPLTHSIRLNTYPLPTAQLRFSQLSGNTLSFSIDEPRVGHQ